MKPLAGILAFALPVIAAATPYRVEVKTPAVIKDFPECAEGMAPGTICRYIPLNAVTFRIPNVNPDLPPLLLKVVMPVGMRSIDAKIKLEVSPSTVCDPVPSEVYDGFGGVIVTCAPGQ
jgi:hypothetical protein